MIISPEGSTTVLFSRCVLTGCQADDRKSHLIKQKVSDTEEVAVSMLKQAGLSLLNEFEAVSELFSTNYQGLHSP